jgi:hypothetical protein
MQHWRLAHAAAVCLILSSATRADEDRVRTTLDAAIAKYDAEAQSVHYSVVKYFDDEEARLRRKGDTAALEQVKAEREEFATTKTLPKGIPGAVLRKYITAVKKMTAAFDKAKASYIKANNDALAADIDQEIALFAETSMKLRDPVPVGSKWRGNRVGTLPSNKPLPSNGGPIEAEVLERGDDSFRIRMTVRRDLVFTADCKLIKGKWVLDKVDANPAGAGRPGLIPITDSRVRVGQDSVEISWEATSQFEAGVVKETYSLCTCGLEMV